MTPTARDLLADLKKHGPTPPKVVAERLGVARETIWRTVKKHPATFEVRDDAVTLKVTQDHAEITQTVTLGHAEGVGGGVSSPSSSTTVSKDVKNNDEANDDENEGVQSDPERDRRGHAAVTHGGHAVTKRHEVHHVHELSPDDRALVSSFVVAVREFKDAVRDAKEALCRTPTPSPSVCVDTPGRSTTLTSPGPAPSRSSGESSTPTTSAPATASSAAHESATPPSEVTAATPLRDRLIGALSDGFDDGENPPSAYWKLDDHGEERCEAALASTAHAKEIYTTVCATILHYLKADKMPKNGPRTLRQLVRDLKAEGREAPAWIRPWLVGLEPAPVSEAQVSRQREREKAPARRTTVTEERDEDDDEPRRRPYEWPRPVQGGAVSTGESLRDVIPKRRVTP